MASKTDEATTAHCDVLLTQAEPLSSKRSSLAPQLPGIVIFVHGVNDPGGNYDIVEKGLCEGLNERLDAFHLVPGRYGEAYAEAQRSTLEPGHPDYPNVASVKFDPDTFLHQRKEVEGDVGTQTHSVFIPFYWGYRAAADEIAHEPPEPDGTQGAYKTVRGQYQDTHGNRLSKHFAKGGGTFNNATTSIPQMFGEGFYASNINAVARGIGAFDAYQFSGNSPHRKYFVLAAERLAMLVREIRTQSADDTITIIGHSQGTLVTLLAQAILADEAQEGMHPAMIALGPGRRADTLILVGSPYSLREPMVEALAQPARPRYTARGKVNTLVNIVKSVTESPHSSPALSDLSATHNPCGFAGRAGPRWKGEGEAERRDSGGATTRFVERDNRGKVYMYYCPEDGTVSLPSVVGIGAKGVPDTISLGVVRHIRSRLGSDVQDTYPAMTRLAEERFFQRGWSRMAKDKKGRDTAVGQTPGHRLHFAGSDCLINAEAIEPPHTPTMYGGEAIQGDEKTKGKMTPDDYAKDLAIGNPDEQMPLVELSRTTARMPPDPQVAMDKFNEGKEPDDRTYSVRVNRRRNVSASESVYITMREETPNETRARIQGTEKAWQSNSYHSAIFADSENLRRVVAFDVAVGQACAIDDPEWRKLLIALADWKLDKKAGDKVKGNCYFASLSEASRELTTACIGYYQRGEFPTRFVRTLAPALIDAETR